MSSITCEEETFGLRLRESALIALSSWIQKPESCGFVWNLLDALTKLNDWSMDRSDNMYPMFMCIKQLCCLTKPTDHFAMRLKTETQHLRNLHVLREISWNISWCKDVDARSMPRQNHDATFFFKLQRHVFTHLSINVCAICCFCCFVPCGKACYLSLHDSFCEDLGHFCGLRELLQLLICIVRIGSTGSTALTTNTRLQPVNGHQHTQLNACCHRLRRVLDISETPFVPHSVPAKLERRCLRRQIAIASWLSPKQNFISQCAVLSCSASSQKHSHSIRKLS